MTKPLPFAFDLACLSTFALMMLIFAGPRHASSQALEPSITPPTSGTAQFQRMLLLDQTLDEGSDEINLVQIDNYDVFAVERIQEHYVRQQRAAKMAMDGYEDLAFISTTFVSVAVDIGTGPTAAATSTLIERGVEKGFKDLNQWVENVLKKDRTSALSSSLARLEQESGVKNWDNLTPEGVVKELENGNYIPFAKIDPDVDADGRSLLMETMIHQLAELDKETWAELAKQGAQIGDLEAITTKQTKDIAKLQGNLTVLWKNTNRHAELLKGIQDGMEEVNKKLSAISSRVSENAGNISENRSDIEFLQETMFGRMSPDEQLASLKNGFFRGMPEEEKQALRERIEVTKSRQEIAQAVNKYAGYTSNLANIANNIEGLDPNLVKDLSTAAQIGNIAAEATTAYLSGNYLAMASSISNLAGIGGQSPEAQRHQQIVGLLQSVLEKQRIMDQKLDRLLEGQRAILENQVKIMELVIDLSRQVSQQHEQLLNEIDELKTEIRTNRVGIRDNILTGPIACRTLVFKNSEPPQTYSEAKTRYEADLNLIYQDCLNGLDDVLRGVGVSDSAFRASWWFDEGHVEEHVLSREKDFVDKIWDYQWQSLTSFLAKYDEELSQRSVFASLVLPSTRIFDLQAKLSQQRLVGDGLHSRWRRWLDAGDAAQNIRIANILASYYSLTSTEALIEQAIRFHPYYELQDPSDPSKLFPREYFLNGGTVQQTGQVILEDAARRADVLVAQQALMSGEAFLPSLYNAFWEENADERKANRRIIHQLMTDNEYLAYNFLLYFVREELTKRDEGFFTYHVALQSAEDDLFWLNKVFGPGDGLANFFWLPDENQPPFVRGSGGSICARLSSNEEDTPNCFVIPNAQEIQDGLFAYRPQLTSALTLQSKVLDHLIAGEILSGQEEALTDQDVNVFRLALLSQPKNDLASQALRSPQSRLEVK